MLASFHHPGTKVAGRYEVAGRPLMGGMGIVYLCYDHQEQRPVALKTFKPEYLPDRAARERFLQEGETWVRLGKHPHIVQAYNVIRIGDGREVYLVLELVAKKEGLKDASLRSWLTPGKPLPVDQALLIALQIVRGMRHATDTIPGFVHRDLKPENILVGADRLSNAAVNRVRVTDFGLIKGLLARQVTETPVAGDLAQGLTRLTRGSSLVGTPLYMAPEQWDGADVAVQADIYALGCILGEMLTGRLLVQSKTLDELRRAHQSEQALAAIAEIPPAVREVLTCCLTVVPAQRWANWSAAEQALGAAYTTITGQQPLAPELLSAQSKTERVAAGSSYDALGLSYLDLGNARAALGFFERARQTSQAEGERQLEAAGLIHLGLAYTDLGDMRGAIACLEAALAIAREIGDRWSEGAALGNLAAAHANLGDAQRAIDDFEEALAIHQEIGDRLGEGNRLRDLGSVYLQLGDAQRAIRYHVQALAVAREFGQRRSEGGALGSLGLDYAAIGDPRRAIEYHDQSLIIRREIGDRSGEGNDLSNLGNAYADLGEVQQAIEFYKQALAIARVIGDRRGESNRLCNLGGAYLDLGDAPQAIGYLELALTIHREIGDRRGVGNDLGNLGNAYRQLGDSQRAVRYLEQALVAHVEVGDQRAEGSDLGSLAIAYKELGNARRALGHYKEALAIHRELGDPSGVAITSFNIALLLAKQGDTASALSLAREAARVWGQMGHAARAQRAQQLVMELERQGR